MKTFKQYLVENPIADYETFGDWSKNSSFRHERDRRLVTNPRTIEMVKKKFGNSPYTFDFYFINSPTANKYTEVGEVYPSWVKEFLGDEVYNAIEKNVGKDHIQVIFTNNKGSQRVPLTAHMMAHRIGHALRRKMNYNMNSGHPYIDASDFLIHSLSQILQYYGHSDFPHSENGIERRYGYDTNRRNQLIMKSFFTQVCTFRSARENNVRDWFEILNELIAQYLTTGKIKFNKAPRNFKGGGSWNKRFNYKIESDEAIEDVNDRLEALARDMTVFIENIFDYAIDRVFVM